MKWILLVINISFAQSNYFSAFADLSLSQRNNKTMFNSKRVLFSPETASEYFKLNGYFNFAHINIDVNGSVRTSEFTKSETQLNIRELYYNYSITDNLEMFVGRKLFRQGSGYYQNPSGFLNAKKVAGDIEDRFKNNVGQDALGFNYYLENSDVEFVYTPYYSLDNGLDIEGHGFVAKYYFLFESTDISLIANFHTEFNNQYGISVANTMTDYLEVHSEVSFKNGAEKNKHIVTDQTVPFSVFQTSPYTRLDDNLAQTHFLIGTNLTTGFGLNIITEYVYNSEKLSKREWSRLVQYSNYLDLVENVPQSAVDGNKMWIANSLNNQKEYLFNRLAINSDDLGLSFISIHNLYDSSAILLGEINQSFSSFSVFLQSTWFVGSKKSDYGNLFSSNTTSLSLSYRF